MSVDVELGAERFPDDDWFNPEDMPRQVAEQGLPRSNDDLTALMDAVGPDASMTEAEPEPRPVPHPVARTAGRAAVSQPGEQPTGEPPQSSDGPRAATSQSSRPSGERAGVRPNTQTTLASTIRWMHRHEVLGPEDLAVVPLPAELTRLHQPDREMVLAAAGILTGRPLPVPSKLEIARSLFTPNVANLVVASQEIVEADAPARGRIGTIRQTAGEMRRRTVDEGTVLLTKTVGDVIYKSYRAHASSTPARALLLGIAARQIGENPEADPELSVAVADRFYQMYERAGGRLGMLPGDVLKPIQVLGRSVREAAPRSRKAGIAEVDYIQDAVSQFAELVATAEVGRAEKRRVEREWRKNQEMLPWHEDHQSRYHNSLVLTSTGELSQLLAYEEESLGGLSVHIASIEQVISETASDDPALAHYRTTLKELETEKTEAEGRMASIGMALFEKGLGARVDQERAITLALETTNDQRLLYELEKIEAAKVYGNWEQTVIEIAIGSAAARRAEIAMGLMTAADALLSVMVKPAELVWTYRGRDDAWLQGLQSQLRALQWVPTQAQPEEGAYVSGVFQHNFYHPVYARPLPATHPARIPEAPPQYAATFYAKRTGVTEIMRVAYLAELLSRGGANVPWEMHVRRQALVADEAERLHGKVDRRGLPMATRELLTEGDKAQRELRKHTKQIDHLLKPYVKQVAEAEAEAGRAAWAAAHPQRNEGRRWR